MYKILHLTTDNNKKRGLYISFSFALKMSKSCRINYISFKHRFKDSNYCVYLLEVTTVCTKQNANLTSVQSKTKLKP